jgi:hypothetical protein
MLPGDREKKRAFDKKVSNRFWRGTDDRANL